MPNNIYFRFSKSLDCSSLHKFMKRIKVITRISDIKRALILSAVEALNLQYASMFL